MASVLSNIRACKQIFSYMIIQMLFFLTSEPSILYINLNSSKGYQQVGFEQLDLVKDVPDHGKWVCV